MNVLRPLTVGGEFDGIGLLAYGLHLAGLRHEWLCEVDPWRRSILELRFPGVPVFDDVRAVGAASAGPVDVIAGGFPCKGASSAGKEEGFGHPETVLWREMRRTISELRPRYVLIENVANLLRLDGGALWGEVLGDLAALGFDVVWDCLPAAAVGAPHRRDRVFAVATYADGSDQRWNRGQRGESRGRQDARGDLEAVADPCGWATQLRGGSRELDRSSGADAGEAQQRQRGGDAAADRPQTVADADQRELGSGRDGRGADGLQADPRGVAVDWGEFGPAVERWERLQGTAPEPLVRRVDDGSTRRVERSRLSALGDGVCVQVGQIAGAYILDLERGRMNSAEMPEATEAAA